MTVCVVRPCLPADSAACVAILALAGRDAFSGVADHAAFLAATQGEDIFVAERDGVLAGFAAVYTGATPNISCITCMCTRPTAARASARNCSLPWWRATARA